MIKRLLKHVVYTFVAKFSRLCCWLFCRIGWNFKKKRRKK